MRQLLATAPAEVPEESPCGPRSRKRAPYNDAACNLVNAAWMEKGEHTHGPAPRMQAGRAPEVPLGRGVLEAQAICFSFCEPWGRERWFRRARRKHSKLLKCGAPEGNVEGAAPWSYETP